MKIKILFTILAVLIIISLLTVLPLVFGFGRTGKNTEILGRDYSLFNKQQILTRLEIDFPLPQTIILKSPTREFSLNLSSISAKLNHRQIVSDLLFRRLSQGFGRYFTAFFSPRNFNLEILFDTATLESYLQQIAYQIDRPFVPSELAVDTKSKSIIINDGELGQKTDIVATQNNLITALKNYQLSSPLEIAITPIGKLPDDTSITHAKSLASKLVGKTIEFTTPDQSIILEDDVLITWLDFDTPCRSDRIGDYISGLKTSLKKDPIDAIFRFENNKVLEFHPSTNGYVLNDFDLDKFICDRITQLVTSPDSKITAVLPITEIPAKVTNSEVNNLGIKELLGRGKSTFKHSSTTRNFNVEKGASIINSILVPPDDTFSFVKNLGEVTIESGFKKAYIIRAGKTELDVGGGICQVSTTLFRAMLDAGLDITERRPHAYRVGYYEEDSPPGYDATVFIPSPDLKFVNDTSHYLLIQSTYNGKDKTLVYEIYGTSDGRRAEISNYRKWGYAPPPPDIYIDDPTLPAGKVIQDEQRIAGLKTAFDWKVVRNGQVIHQKTFQSSYVPWAAVFRRGVQL